MIGTYKDLVGRHWEGDDIPHWIHRSGPKSIDQLPSFILKIYNDTIELNSGYELFYFDNKDCSEFIFEEWGEEYTKLYSSLIPGAFKSDFFRYLLLYRYGGHWGDLTQTWVQPYINVAKDVDRVFPIDYSSPRYLYNALMLVKAKDEVMRLSIEMASENIRNRFYGKDRLSITGPAVLGEAFRRSPYYISTPNGNILKGKYNNSLILPVYTDEGVGYDLQGDKLYVWKDKGHNTHLYGTTVPHNSEYWIKRNVYYE